MKIKIESGIHSRKNCPVSVSLPTSEIRPFLDSHKNTCLVSQEGVVLPCTLHANGENTILTFVIDILGANESVSFDLVLTDKTSEGFEITDNEEGLLIRFGSSEVASYHTATDIPKPYLGHLRERWGTPLTRIDPTVREHPHHRALWISHGSVNGIDTWNERPGTHGFERVKDITGRFQGSAAAGFTAHNIWTDHSGNPLCDETTSYTFYATAPGLMLIDLHISLTASYTDVELGSTKEAGPLAVRMADAMTVVNGGRMENAEGGINEDEIWMKPSAWVDYWGTNNGHTGGIAIFDSPDNRFFPTLWHARNYGLMAANNYHIRGAEKIPFGESLSWSYRVAVHNGNTSDAGISSLWTDYASPIKTTIEE